MTLPRSAHASSTQSLEKLIQETNTFLKTHNALDAEGRCLDILKLDPNNVSALTLMHNIRWQQNRKPESLGYLHAILSVAPHHYETYLKLGQKYYSLEKMELAAEMFKRAALLKPDEKIAYANFLMTISELSFKSFDSTIKNVFMTCLKRDDLFHKYSGIPWRTLLECDPMFAPLFRLKTEQNFTMQDLMGSIDLVNALNDDFFIFGLYRLTNCGESLETILTNIRITLLKDCQKPCDDFIKFLYVFSIHNFFNEYVFFQSEKEKIHVGELEESISQNLEQKKPDQNLLTWQSLIYGCYTPLYQHPNAQKLLKVLKGVKTDNFLFHQFIKLQLEDAIAEKKIKATITSFSEIEDHISKKVQNQYEDYPYPRWMNMLSAPPDQEQRAYTDGKKILVAGCGTGQEPIKLAQSSPGAEITAIDLSFASLAYAKRKAQEMDLSNINFIQGDILNVKNLNCEFDLIISSGVLHHMHDPDEGLAALLGVLRTGGIMKIALYSDIARAYLNSAQSLIKKNPKKYPPTSDGIRKLRHDLRTKRTHQTDLNMQKVISSRSFFTLSECCDLLFHVQEHRYTIPKIRKLLEKFELSFLGFRHTAQKAFAKYRLAYPDDINFENLDQFERFEQENPVLFQGMYNFWLQRENDLDHPDRMKRYNRI